MLKAAVKTIDNMIKTIFFTVASSRVMPNQTVLITGQKPARFAYQYNGR